MNDKQIRVIIKWPYDKILPISIPSYSFGIDVLKLISFACLDDYMIELYFKGKLVDNRMSLESQNIVDDSVLYAYPVLIKYKGCDTASCYEGLHNESSRLYDLRMQMAEHKRRIIKYVPNDSDDEFDDFSLLFNQTVLEKTPERVSTEPLPLLLCNESDYDDVMHSSIEFDSVVHIPPDGDRLHQDLKQDNWKW